MPDSWKKAALRPLFLFHNIFVQPVADFAQAAQAVGALPVTLGPRILRTETAAIAALAMAMLRFGDAGGAVE